MLFVSKGNMSGGSRDDCVEGTCMCSCRVGVTGNTYVRAQIVNKDSIVTKMLIIIGDTSLHAHIPIHQHTNKNTPTPIRARRPRR